MPHRSHPPAPRTAGATKKEILELTRANNVRFLRLQFTDILGVNKNVEIPASQFEKALDGDIMFDGSSIEGFVRIEESDMLLAPDLVHLPDLPVGERAGTRSRASSATSTRPTTSPSPAIPAAGAQAADRAARKLGYTMNAGMEAEFFLFKRAADGARPPRRTMWARYFDLAPVDLGEDARRSIVDDPRAMGFEVEAAHHEVAHGQHEIDFRYADALTTADNIATFRFVVKYVAQQFGLVASFMPKPVFGQNGSGMHTHQSLFKGKDERVLGPEGGVGTEQDRAPLYRRAAAARARLLRDHQPAGEFSTSGWCRATRRR